MSHRTEPGLSRRDVLKRGTVAGVALGGLNVLAGCGGASSASTTSGEHTTSAGGPPTGGTPVRGGTLTIGQITGGQAETVIAGKALTTVDFYRAQQLFDGLFNLGPDLRPVPALAESAEHNADATVWTLKVRSGVTWHDGKALTAEDVAASIKSWLSPGNYGAVLAQALIDGPGVRARGPLTVEVPLKVPVAEFPGFSCMGWFYITRPDVYQKGVKPIGTGPFKYQSFTPGQQSVFPSNENYWGGAPYIDQQIVNSAFGNDTARVNALLSGSVDIVPAVAFSVGRTYANSGQVYVGHAQGSNTYWHQCRVDLAPFKNPKAMLALRLLCDRPVMVQSVFDGYAAESNDLPCPGCPYYSGPDVFPILKYDPEQAKSLLKAAGYPNPTITLYTSDVAPGVVEGATAYATQAAAGGVKVNVVTVDPAVYFTPNGPAGGYLKYPMFANYPSGGSIVPCMTLYYLLEYWTKGADNETHFGNAYTDKLIFDAIGEVNPAQAQEKWNAIQKVLYDRGGSIVFGIADFVDGYARHVRGVQTNPSGYLGNNNVSKAWIAKT